jgi:hypothetical protein
VRVFSDTSPGVEYEPTEADLEDVYFSTMAGYYGESGERAQLMVAR